MSEELIEGINNAIKERNTKLKDAKVSPEFWIKENKNILKAIAEGRKMKESM